MKDKSGTDRQVAGSIQAAFDAEHARIAAELSGHAGGSDPFVAAVRATCMPIIISDPRRRDNPVVFANDAFCRMTGYSREEVLGRNCRFLQGEQTDPAAVQIVREAVAACQPVEVDLRNHRKDGAPFWNRLQVAPVWDARGDVAYFFASQLDVTLERERLTGLENDNAALLAQLKDRLRAQEESEARLRFATQAGWLGIWELDLRTGALTTSAICRETFGRDANAPFSYAEWLQAAHADDRERMQAALEQSAASGRDCDIEYRLVRADGSAGWVNVRARVLVAEDGTKLRMAGTSLDITKRKRADLLSRALLELDDQLHALEEPADLAYAAAEILGRTLGLSRAGYGTVDAAQETVTVERDWNAPGVQSVTGTHRLRDYGFYVQDLRRGEIVVVEDAERDPRTAARSQHLIAVNARALINLPMTEQGELVAVLYLSYDGARAWLGEEVDFARQVAVRTRMVVERRRAEQRLRRLADSLEGQVASRTEALMAAEAALRQSQKMEAVGQLTGGLAHDFNNLLTGICGSLELIANRVAQGRVGDVPRYVKAAQGAANRAAALTHRLLAFSRRQTLEPKAANLNHLVGGLEELIRRTVGPAVSVTVQGTMTLWNTMVDPSQFENALLNLCINARDAMPGGGHLMIGTNNHQFDTADAATRELAPGDYVVLTVSDTGTGMPPEVIAKAFDPFFTTKPTGQGTGLGLSMIYGFARQSGGNVRIQSTVGQGTAIALYLPRFAGPTEEASPAPRIPTQRRAGPGEVVLVVDDEAMVRMLVTDVMQDLGYRTVEASSGRAALDLLRSEQRIDLLVTDVGLPGGMDGWQLAQNGRAVRPALKILFITGYAENTAIGQGTLQPGMQVLPKPFAVDMLAARVQELTAAAPVTDGVASMADL